MDKGKPKLCADCTQIAFRDLYQSDTVIIIDERKHSGLKSVSALHKSAATCTCCAFLCRELLSEIHLSGIFPSADASSGTFPAELESQPLLLRVASTRVRINSNVRAEAWRALRLAFIEEAWEDISVSMRIATAREIDAEPVLVGPTGARPARQFYCRAVPEMLTVPEVGRIVKAWHQQCAEEHDTCSVSGDKILPDRVLDVGTIDKPLLKLAEVAEDEQRGDYIALSYCWGPHGQTRTLKENYDAFKQQVDEEALPTTIRDAIMVTRALGISYLWIDALCIVQDDAHDWDVQSAKMQQVYSESFLTLCAANAHAVRDGIFRPRPDTIVEVDMVEEDGAQRSVYLVPSCDKDAHLRQVTEHTPLGVRGWCLQERLLSPRKIYFHNQQLIWECSERFFFESGVTRGSLSNGSLEMPVSIVGSVHNINMRQWEAVVGSYTACQLTKMTDRLPAIAGVAAYFVNQLAAREEAIVRGEVEATHDPDDDEAWGSLFDGAVEEVGSSEYIAGHWKEDFIRSLLWKVTIPGHPEVSQEYWAPSWSWASAPGQVKFREECAPHDNFARWSGLEYHVELAGVNIWGSVKEGTVSITIPMVEVTYETDASGNASLLMTPGGGHRLVPDTGSSLLDSGIYLDRRNIHGRMYAAVLYTDFESRASEEEVFEGQKWEGLLLRSDDGVMYKRQGSFWRCNFQPGSDGSQEGGPFNLSEVRRIATLV
jgi:hypothetical protein